MKIPREVWWVGGLIAIMLLIGLLAGGGRKVEEQGSIRRTTYSSRPSGLRALFVTLRELGYHPRRLRTPFAQAVLPKRGALVIVDPALPVAQSEWAAVDRWVEAGNLLIVAGGSVLPGMEAALPPLAEIIQEAPMSYARPCQPSYLANQVERLAIRGDGRMKVPQPWEKAQQRDRRRSRLFETDRHGQLSEIMRLAAPVFGDDKGTVVGYARLGRGQVVLLANSWSVSNQGIAQGDNLIFVLNALGAAGRVPVFFDEYHQGYGKNIAWALMPLPIKIALGHLLLGLLVVVYACSRRFGRIIPLDRGRRQRSEFLGTMTGLLRKGQATRLAVRTAYEGAMERLRLELGLAAAAGPEEVAAAAGRVRPQAEEELSAALRRCSEALRGRDSLSEGRAVALVRELDRAVESVRRI